ncbi:hypothetical protein, partial [Limosilactobacillus reuteri]|uniref:hypothetical protein n=1 Tax=Limosilactobacillus reuteri TaxID=1598 RepID=UPI00207C8992
YRKKYENHVDLDYVEEYKISFHPPNEFHPEMWHIKTDSSQYEYKSRRSIKEFCHQIRFEKLLRIF